MFLRFFCFQLTQSPHIHQSLIDVYGRTIGINIYIFIRLGLRYPPPPQLISWARGSPGRRTRRVCPRAIDVSFFSFSRLQAPEVPPEVRKVLPKGKRASKAKAPIRGPQANLPYHKAAVMKILFFCCFFFLESSALPDFSPPFPL